MVMEILIYEEHILKYLEEEEIFYFIFCGTQ